MADELAFCLLVSPDVVFIELDYWLQSKKSKLRFSDVRYW